MDRNNSNDRTTAGAIAATVIITSIALLALAGLGGVSCAAIDENAGGSEGEIAGAAVSAASVTDRINYQGRLTGQQRQSAYRDVHDDVWTVRGLNRRHGS